jgi:ketosteroid isomerase-like protein
MRLSEKTGFRILTGALIVLLGCAAFPAVAAADDASEIKKVIHESNDYGNKNLKDMEGGISEKGQVAFFSSGGLLQELAADAEPTEYEHLSIHPKHIKVISLVEGAAAVAMYYAEGSMHVKGNAPVAHYMTRVTEVYVKEGEEWKVRAAHWSPIAAGSGTSQTSIP